MDIALDRHPRDGMRSSAPSDIVCWSRMQAEAGQELAAIVARKEVERRFGDGVFFWGVGNAPGSAGKLVRKWGIDVDVIFSIMKTPPKAMDRDASELYVWRCYIDAQGCIRDLPPSALVTSRAKSAHGAKQAHYALVCQSAAPLELQDGGPFDPSAYRNLGGRGGPIGYSQVTALLQRVQPEGADSSYRVNLRSKLAPDGWVRLVDPVLMTRSHMAEMQAATADLASITSLGWRNLVRRLRSDLTMPPGIANPQLCLL